MFAIEKGVPFTATQGRKGLSKYPFADLEIGDSFLVPYNGKETGRVQATMYASMRPHRSIGKDFKTSKQADGIRVWRIA